MNGNTRATDDDQLSTPKTQDPVFKEQKNTWHAWCNISVKKNKTRMPATPTTTRDVRGDSALQEPNNKPGNDIDSRGRTTTSTQARNPSATTITTGPRQSGE
ncbi:MULTISPECIES: hypothetical protein [Modicisalibacter]|uniref:Uncharacterized protein n=1 Tax=Modicisalibacter tunisiensis TaxID=390637 RepID=A0ABS7WVC3_9GAMM|nr:MULTISPECIES: hypothetical protein [Modicisalibacter]MBZ9540070.1 hypothetical protein [Modicisalibacter tunisiensis]MBZ9566536.1 hypothetical protein [Modicisalibacter tunisiensis]